MVLLCCIARGVAVTGTCMGADTGTSNRNFDVKKALKADIDAESWDSLNLTESRPFDKPETGKIAVKVMKVFAV